MKKITILAFLISYSFISFAQKVSFEKLEEFSKQISNSQLEVNSKTYNDGTTDYEISFPESNFEVAFNSQLATKAIYKKINGKEALYLTENIDMSKTIGMHFFNESKDLVGLKLYFPKGNLSTKIIENGTVIKTIKEDYLAFFLNKNSSDKGNGIFNVIYDLSTSLKKEKGMITPKTIDQENKDWYNLTVESYITKHPTSLRTMQAKNILENRKIAEINKIKEGETQFMNYSHLNYKLGFSAEETKKKYPELSLKNVKDDKQSNELDELISSKKKIKFYVKNNIVIGYQGEITSNMNRKNNYTIYKETFEVGNKIKEELNTKFRFTPIVQKTDNPSFYYRYDGRRIDYSDIPTKESFDPHDFSVSDGDKVSYIWKRNEKTVRLDIIFNKKDKLLTLIMGYDIIITIIDENLAK